MDSVENTANLSPHHPLREKALALLMAGAAFSGILTLSGCAGDEAPEQTTVIDADTLLPETTPSTEAATTTAPSTTTTEALPTTTTTTVSQVEREKQREIALIGTLLNTGDSPQEIVDSFYNSKEIIINQNRVDLLKYFVYELKPGGNFEKVYTDAADYTSDIKSTRDPMFSYTYDNPVVTASGSTYDVMSPTASEIKIVVNRTERTGNSAESQTNTSKIAVTFKPTTITVETAPGIMEQIKVWGVVSEVPA